MGRKVDMAEENRIIRFIAAEYGSKLCIVRFMQRRGSKRIQMDGSCLFSGTQMEVKQ
jgi:hypothetical protein